MNIILVEYPKYLIYLSNNMEPRQIYDNSLRVYDWLPLKIKIPTKNIFIYSRSLGISLAIYLSSQRNVNTLFLISAFTTMKDIGNDNYCSWLFEDIFPSINFIEQGKCPILLIHGMKDKLISFEHSQKLEKRAKMGINKCVSLQLNNIMTHNEYDIQKYIIEHIYYFMN